MRRLITIVVASAAALTGAVRAEEPAEPEKLLRGRVVAGVAAGRHATVYVSLVGRTTRARLIAASDEKLTVRPSGVAMELRWTQVGPARRLGIYAKYIDRQRAGDWLALARYAAGAGLTDRAREYAGEAARLDPSLKKEAEAIGRAGSAGRPGGSPSGEPAGPSGPATTGEGRIAPGGDKYPIPIFEAVSRRALALMVDEPTGTDRRGVPVVGSVPVPRGELKTPASVRLLDGSGREVPCQARALALWPEGTVKWLNLVCVADVKRSTGSRFTLEYGTAVRPAAPAARVSVTGGGASAKIDTGAATFSLSAGGPHLISSASLENAGTIIGGTGARGLYLDLGPVGGGTQRKRLSVRVTKLTVEERGPVRAVVRADAEATGGTRPIPLVLRLHAYAGSATVELRHTFVFTCEPKSESIAAMGYELPLRVAAKTVAFGDSAGRLHTAPAAGGLAALQEKHDAFTLAGARSEKGRRLAGWMDASGAESGVTVAVRDFYRLFPKGIALSADGRKLDVALWPAGAAPLVFGRKPGQTDEGFYRNSEMIGVAKTHHMMIHLHAGDHRKGRAAETAAAFDRPSVPFASTKWNVGSRVLGFVGDHNAAPLHASEHGAEALWDFLLYHQHNEPWYGAMDYGDMQDVYESRQDTWRYLRGRWGWHGQMFHDLAMLTQYLRTGKRKYFESGVALSRHMSDVDTVHFARPGHRMWTDKVGSVHRHNAQHWVDVGEAKYTRPQGWLLTYYLTGDRRVWEVIEKEATPFLIAERAKNLLGTYSGQMNWGLMGMWEATGDAKYKALVKEFLDALIARQAADGGFAGLAENEYYFFNTGWVHLMVEYHNLTGDEKVGRAIARMAERRLRGPWGQTWAAHIEGTRLYAAAWRQTGNAKYLEAIRSGLRRSFGSVGRQPKAKTREGVKRAAVATGSPQLWKFDIIVTDLLQLPYGTGALQGEGGRK